MPLDIVPNRFSPDNDIDSRVVKIAERVMGSLAVICSLLIPFDKARTDEEKTQDGARADCREHRHAEEEYWQYR